MQDADEAFGIGQAVGTAALGEAQNAVGSDLGNTLSQAEGALGSVQNADEVLEVGQAVGSDLGTVTDFTLDGVQRANDELGFGETLGDIEEEANDVFGYASSEGAIGGGQLQKGCRLERGSSSVGSRPGECFREPECNEVCYDGEEEECSISNEEVCRTVPEQVIFTTSRFLINL